MPTLDGIARLAAPAVQSMTVFTGTLTALFFTAVICPIAYATDPTAKSEAFQPFELIGSWQFTNSNTGVRYGGDVKVFLTDVDSTGLMHGKISYDGRQTNDVCSTRGIFRDEPVDVEVAKSEHGYKISFMVKCARGESPRLRSWILTCKSGVCTRPEVQSHGRGLLTLAEKR